MTFCPNCGSDVEPNLKFCSKCGTKLEDEQPAPQTVYVQPQPQPTYAPPQPSYAPQPTYPSYGTRPYGAKGGNSFGIGALICGIIGLLLSPIFVFGIVAIVLGGLGLKRDDSPGMATAGIVLGIIGFICGIILIIAIFSIMSMYYSPFYYY